jgi:hypothetical protein
MNRREAWLGDYSWDFVVAQNAALCEARGARLASGLIASTQRRSIAKASAAGLLLVPIFYLLATNF